jgi:Ca2+-binding RTX toxin-like protein
MATINGTNGNNVLVGTIAADNIQGLGGNDRIFGRPGNDSLDGGDGLDQIFGDAGRDLLFGRAGNDVLNGGLGADRMEGGAGNDLFFVDNSRDQTLESGNQGTDTVRSTVTFSLAVAAHVENLQLVGALAINGFGNGLDNRLSGNNAANVLRDTSLSSRDILNGLGGNDRLFAGHGNDACAGGSGNDRLDGGRGNDNMLGSSGNDLLFGGETNMPLSGTDNDRMNGGAGDDTLIGGFGRDILTGGAGADRFVYQNQGQSNPSPFAGVDVILDFDRAQGDKINLAAIDADAGSPGNQAFFFIGTAPFNPFGAAGQLRVSFSATETIVQGSTDFDNAAEFVIRVRGTRPDDDSDYFL